MTSCSGAASGNYLIGYVGGAFKVKKAQLTVTASSPADLTYGDAAPAVTASYDGFVNGDDADDLTAKPSCGSNYSQGDPVGDYVTSCSGAASGNYLIGYVGGAFKVGKATPDCSSIAGYSVTYDASAHTATGSCKGVTGAVLNGLDLTGTTHTNAGTYDDDPWTFTDQTGNYKDLNGAVDDKIAQAKATITVTPYDVTYDGDEHTATGSAKGVGGVNLGGLDLSKTKHTDAGDYTDDWSFDGGNNYENDGGKVNDKIGKAKATITVTPYDVTYDGNEQTATGSAKGVNNETLSGLDLSKTKHTNAGSYTDNWSFTNANYSDDSGSVTDKIGKAQPTVNINWSGSTYNGSANAASASVSGVGSPPANLGPADSLMYFSGTGTSGNQLAGEPKDAGTYTVKADYLATANYKAASNTKTITIAKANASIAITWNNSTYNGSPNSASASASGVGSPAESLGSATLTYYSGSTATGTPLSGA